MNCLKKILVCVSAICLISCGNDESMVGTWAQPVPGLEGMKQGFTLEEGGKASSINMATLCYETWKQEGTLLILSGKSTGKPSNTPDFTDTLTIEQLTQGQPCPEAKKCLSSDMQEKPENKEKWSR